MITKFSDILLYDNCFPIEFILKQKLFLIKEDSEYITKPAHGDIPRFTLKNIKGLEDIPINKPIQATEKLITTAIKYGMIFDIQYKGAKDLHAEGHERYGQFMVIGRSAQGKILIRFYHLKGFSISNNKNIEKIWRMIRLDRIKSVTFSGSFYRLPPEGYKSDDKGMLGGIIARADFNEIRKNQQELLKGQEIQNKKDIELNSEEGLEEFVKIKVKDTSTQLDILNPYENTYIENEKNSSLLRITFLKSLSGNKFMAIIGALGEPNHIVKITDEKGKDTGTYKVLDSIGGDVLKKIKKVKGNNLFDLFIFDKKL